MDQEQMPDPSAEARRYAEELARKAADQIMQENYGTPPSPPAEPVGTPVPDPAEEARRYAEELARKAADQIMQENYGTPPSPPAEPVGTPVPDPAEEARRYAEELARKAADTIMQENYGAKPAVTADVAQAKASAVLKSSPADALEVDAKMMERGRALHKQAEVAIHDSGVAVLRTRTSITARGKVVTDSETAAGSSILAGGDVIITGPKPNTAVKCLNGNPLDIVLREFMVIRRVATDHGNVIKITTGEGAVHITGSGTDYDAMVSRKPTFIIKVGEQVFVYSDNPRDGYVTVSGSPCKGCTMSTAGMQSDIVIGNVITLKVSNI